MTWMQTHTGLAFDYEALLDGRRVEIDGRDLAVSLSRVNRFLGHTTTVTWSVAQHSLAMSHYVEPEHALAALLHDAAEAYVGDLPAPLRWMMREIAKRAHATPQYEMIEREVAAAIERWAELPAGAFRQPAIKHADLRMLATERDLFMHLPQPRPWIELPPRYELRGEHATLWEDAHPDAIADAFEQRLKEMTGDA